MNIKTLLFFSMILVYSDVFAAEQITIYRWIDKEDVVHFSQNQPPHDDYIEISMAKNQKSAATIEKDMSSLSSQSTDKSFVTAQENSDAIDNINQDKCITARDNFSTLQNFDKIQYKDETGNVKVLGALEKQQQLAMNEKQVEVYCTE